MAARARRQMEKVVYRVGQVKLPGYVNIKYISNPVKRTFDLLFEDVDVDAKSPGTKVKAPAVKDAKSAAGGPSPAKPPKQLILRNMKFRNFSLTADSSREHKMLSFTTEPRLVPTYNTIITNMLNGFYYGYNFDLTLFGRGFKYELENNNQTIWLSLGYAHRIKYDFPSTVVCTPLADKKTVFRLEGYNLQELRRVISELRAFRKLDPYKGKGIRMAGEIIKLKKTKRISAKKG